jgi:hypothetical protein
MNLKHKIIILSCIKCVKYFAAVVDDDWLTSSFFLTLTREQLDGVRETLDQSNGPSGELNTQKILIESHAGTIVQRNQVYLLDGRLNCCGRIFLLHFLAINLTINLIIIYAQ